MRRPAIIASALILVLAGGTIAVAQIGGSTEEATGEEATGRGATDFARCVSEASEAGVERPDETECAHLKPGDDEGQREGAGRDPSARGENGEGKGEREGERNPTAGLDVPPADGHEFGEEVSRRAREFGPPERAGGGDGNARNPTNGMTLPPEQGGRSFGEEIQEKARGNKPERGAGSGPPEGVTQGPPPGLPQGGGPPSGGPPADPPGSK